MGSSGVEQMRWYDPVGTVKYVDPTGHYIRKWCPELARLPDKYLRAPWTGVCGSHTRHHAFTRACTANEQHWQCYNNTCIHGTFQNRSSMSCARPLPDVSD